MVVFLFNEVMQQDEDNSIVWKTRKLDNTEWPFIVFGEILCYGFHIMWQAVECGLAWRYADSKLNKAQDIANTL